MNSPTGLPLRGSGILPPLQGGAGVIFIPVADADRLISMTPPASTGGSAPVIHIGSRS